MLLFILCTHAVRLGLNGGGAVNTLLVLSSEKEIFTVACCSIWEPGINFQIFIFVSSMYEKEQPEIHTTLYCIVYFLFSLQK